MKAYREAIRLNPSFDLPWNNLGIILYEQKNYDEASRCYQEAIRLNPGSVMPRYNQGLILFDTGRYDQALAYFSPVLDEDPQKFNHWYYQVRTLHELNNHPEALVVAEKALHQFPGNVDVMILLALSLHRLGRYTESTDFYNQLLTLAGEHSMVYYNKARLHAETNEADLMYEALERAVELNPSYRDTVKADPDFSPFYEEARFITLVATEVTA